MSATKGLCDSTIRKDGEIGRERVRENGTTREREKEKESGNPR